MARVELIHIENHEHLEFLSCGSVEVEAIAFWVTNEVLPIHFLTLECRRES